MDEETGVPPDNDGIAEMDPLMVEKAPPRRPRTE
jgi:hypothetical protein